MIVTLLRLDCCHRMINDDPNSAHTVCDTPPGTHTPGAHTRLLKTVDEHGPCCMEQRLG